MFAKVCSAAGNGIEAYPVEVEVNADYGEALIKSSLASNSAPNLLRQSFRMTQAEPQQKRINQLLLRAGSLNELKPFFPNRGAALAYHAQRMAEMFKPEKILTECESCHRRSPGCRVTFLWRGFFHTTATAIGTIIGILVALGGHSILPHRRVDFTTTHGLCTDCFRQIRVRKMLGELAEKLCFVVIFLASSTFGISVVMTPVLVFLRPTVREITVIVVGLGGGLICLVGGLLGADKVVRWCVPQSLRFISKRPFQLTGLKKLCFPAK